MKKLQITRDSPDHDELVVLYRKEKDPRLKERYQALYLMHELKNCAKIAEIIKRSQKSIQSWVNAFNEGGLEGIVPGKPPGRPPQLSENQMEELKKDILTHPRKLGYEFSNWEGKSVSEHIKKKFSIFLKVRRCQYLLHELGFTLQRPRYKFPKADLEKQKEFKKDFKKNSIFLAQSM